MFHNLLFIYVFISTILYFWLAYRNREKICRTVFIFFCILMIGGATVLWLDINIKNIKQLKTAASPTEGWSLSVESNIEGVVSAKDETKMQVVDEIKEVAHKLYVEPSEIIFYIPDKPQVEGQVKAKISALVKNPGRTVAKNVNFNFIVDTGTGRIISSKKWNELIGRKRETFDIFPNALALLSWTPDMPSEQFYIDNKDKSIKLTIEVEWEDVTGQLYKTVNHSEVKYDENKNIFYFEIAKSLYHKL